MQTSSAQRSARDQQDTSGNRFRENAVVVALKKRFRCVMLAFVLCLPVLPASAQGAQRKNLLKQIGATGPDTARVSLLNKLCINYLSDGELSPALRYGNEALALAKKIGDEPGIAVSCTNIGHCYSYKDNPKALAMFREALRMNRKLGRESQVADAYVNIGNIYEAIADYGNALKCYSYALRFAQRTHATDLEADAAENLGITYHDMGDYPSAIKMLYHALKLFDQLKDNAGKADVQNCLGNVYADQLNYPMALQMYYSSLALCKRLRDEAGTANAYSNIALLYADLKRYEAAISMNRKALSLFRSAGDMTGIALSYNNLARIFYAKGMYAAALDMCEKSLQVSTQIDDPIEANDSHVIRARVYIRQGKLKQAKQLLDGALNTYRSVGHKLHIGNVYKALIELDSVSHDYKAAFEHHKLFVVYRDSIDNEEAERKSYQTALKYRFDKKALEEKRRHESAVLGLREKNRLSSQRQQFLLLVLVILVLAMGVIWFFVRRANAADKKYYAVLSNENEHKEALLQEVHHRVNNSLQMISSLLSMQADSSDNEEIRAYLLKSENRVQAMSVMHRLLHLGNSKLEVDIGDYLGEVMDFYSDLVDSEPGIRLEVSVPPVLFHTKVAMPLALILNELVTNTLKYAFPENRGTITVSLEKDPDGSWLFRVADDGTGFSEKAATGDRKSIGLGLVRLMARQINGELTLISDRGTSVTIRFTEKS